MDGLRLALLVIGAVIVAAVYWNSRRRNAAEIRNSELSDRIEPGFEDDDAREVSEALSLETTDDPPFSITAAKAPQIAEPAEDPADGVAPGADDVPGSDVPQKVISMRIVGKAGKDSDLKDRRFAGLSFFMLRPGPGRGVDAFDRMVETARAVAITLQGELLDGDGSTLSIQRERFMREDLIQYELKHLKL